MREWHDSVGIPVGMHQSSGSRPARPPIQNSVTPVLVIAGLLAAMVTTQYVAPRVSAVVGSNTNGLRHAPMLYGHLYWPTNLIGWFVRYHGVRALTSVWQHAMVVCGGTFGGLVTILLAVTRLTRIMGKRPISTAHGSARWGTGTAHVGTAGVILGRVMTTPRAQTRGTRWRWTRNASFIRYAGDGHLLTVAPTRSGKGVSLVIPNLLTYPGSVVVSDPKGENYAVTKRARSAMSMAVHALDPFGIVGGTAAFNPLTMIDAHAPDAIDDARLVADMLVVPNGPENGEAAFWNEEARGLLTGLVLCVAAHEPPVTRTLTTVRQYLTKPPDQFGELLDRMAASDAADGLVARAAARVRQKAEKERSGVISSAQAQTHFLDSPQMTRVLGASTLDFAALKGGQMSVYLVLPPERMDTYQRWMRLMIACALRAMTRTVGQPRERVLFLLDEFAHLGRMGPVERDISLVGGYGASLWLFVQSLAQLKAIYGPAWATFAANVDVLQTFGIRDWETADYISRMTGEATIVTDSENRSRGISRGKHGARQEGMAETWSERGRRLLLPDEVRRMPASQQIVIMRNEDPIQCEKVDYRIDAAFAGRFAPNPMFRPASER